MTSPLNQPETATPVVNVRDGRVFASSRDVAAFFGKRHNDVLRDIDNLLKQEADLGLRSFAQTPYVESQNGQTYRSFSMDRDGFTLLAMGFTGAQALRWKLRYIEAFNAMEEQLRSQGAAAVNLNDPSQLRALLLTYAEKQEALERQVTELLPCSCHRSGRWIGSRKPTDRSASRMRPRRCRCARRICLPGWRRMDGSIGAPAPRTISASIQRPRLASLSTR